MGRHQSAVESEQNKPCVLRVLEGSAPNPGCIGPMHPTCRFGQLHSTHGIWEDWALSLISEASLGVSFRSRGHRPSDQELGSHGQRGGD